MATIEELQAQFAANEANATFSDVDMDHLLEATADTGRTHYFDVNMWEEGVPREYENPPTPDILPDFTEKSEIEQMTTASVDRRFGEHDTDIALLQSDMTQAQSDITTAQSDIDTAETNISTLQNLISGSGADILIKDPGAVTQLWFDDDQAQWDFATNGLWNVGWGQIGAIDNTAITGWWGIYGNEANWPGIEIWHRHASASAAGYIWFNKARGTYTAPAQINAGDLLGAIGWAGRNATGNTTAARIDVQATTNTGTLKPTMNFYVDGEAAADLTMNIDSNRNVTIFGPNGDMSVAWGSPNYAYQLLHLKNAASCGMKITCDDGASGNAGYIAFSDATTDEFAGIWCYNPTTGNGNMEIWTAASGDILIWNDIFMTGTTNGKSIYFKKRSASAGNVTDNGEVWVRTSDGSLMYSWNGSDYVLQTPV